MEYIGAVFFPAILIQNSELMLNFGDHPFKYEPCLPGYVSISKASSKHIFHSESNQVYIGTGQYFNEYYVF